MHWFYEHSIQMHPHLKSIPKKKKYQECQRIYFFFLDFETQFISSDWSKKSFQPIIVSIEQCFEATLTCHLVQVRRSKEWQVAVSSLLKRELIEEFSSCRILGNFTSTIDDIHGQSPAKGVSSSYAQEEVGWSKETGEKNNCRLFAATLL